MSYYDHAVMITYRLGPWAEAGKPDHHEIRRPPRRKPFSAVFKRIGQVFRSLRGGAVKQARPDQQARTETDDGKPLPHA